MLVQPGRGHTRSCCRVTGARASQLQPTPLNQTAAHQDTGRCGRKSRGAHREVGCLVNSRSRWPVLPGLANEPACGRSTHTQPSSYTYKFNCLEVCLHGQVKYWLEHRDSRSQSNPAMLPAPKAVCNILQQPKHEQLTVTTRQELCRPVHYRRQLGPDCQRHGKRIMTRTVITSACSCRQSLDGLTNAANTHQHHHARQEGWYVNARRGIPAQSSSQPVSNKSARPLAMCTPLLTCPCAPPVLSHFNCFPLPSVMSSRCCLRYFWPALKRSKGNIAQHLFSHRHDIRRFCALDSGRRGQRRRRAGACAERPQLVLPLARWQGPWRVTTSLAHTPPLLLFRSLAVKANIPGIWLQGKCAPTPNAPRTRARLPTPELPFQRSKTRKAEQGTDPNHASHALAPLQGPHKSNTKHLRLLHPCRANSSPRVNMPSSRDSALKCLVCPSHWFCYTRSATRWRFSSLHRLAQSHQPPQ